MVFVIERASRGGLLTALPEYPGQTGRYSVEVVPIFPRSDLDPSLSSFERAVMHVYDILAQVQQLLREDLADLRPPLDICLRQAQSEEEYHATMRANACFEQMLCGMPLQLERVLDCFPQSPTLRAKRFGQEGEAHNTTLTMDLCTTHGPVQKL